ncbi:MAG: DASH family cryptochrome [Robiginitalea sp.]|nr:DASH family cryptochrome [Robiginitalea sp.]
MMTTALHWFRNDLRETDNDSLLKACEADRVLAVYCFDPRLFERDPHGFPRTGKFRAQFLRETLQDLSERLRGLNIPLFIYHRPPEEVLPELVSRFGVSEIHAQREWTRDETRVRDAVRAQLPDAVRFQEHYDQFLFHPQDIPYEEFQRIPEVFTRFRKDCEKQARVRECLPPPEKRPDAHWIEPEAEIPDLESLGLESFQTHPHSAFPFRGGGTSAWERLHSYFWEDKRLSFYKKTRNGLLGTDYSSKFSPWLANGSLSARQVYHQVRKYEREVVRNQDTYWLIFELIWRDYFKYISLKHGDCIFHLEGIRGEKYAWGHSKEALQRWIHGETDNDFVNANMRELLHTGWMSNRGRQNVASYWAKTLEQDWRAGAAWFESMLLDYDVHSNWGNWMYNSGVGNDPRDRKFNPSLQAERYDPKGSYRRLWLQPTLF